MNRFLSKVVTSFLLGVTLLLTAVGFRSYRIADVVTIFLHGSRDTSSCELSLATGSGHVILVLRRDNGKLSKEAVGRYPCASWTTQLPEQMMNLNWEKNAWRRMGFLAQSSEHRGVNSVTKVNRVGAPFWIVALAIGMLGAMPVVRRLRRNRRRKLGLCSRCAYDIRVTPDRCPECGVPVEPIRHISARSKLGSAVIVVLALTVAAVFIFTGSVRQNIRASTVPDSHPRDLPSTQLAHPDDVPDGFRATASTIDPSKTYVFFFVTSRADLLRLNIASVQVFQRRDGKWRGDVSYLKPGQLVGTPGHLTSLKVKSIRANGDDLLLTLLDADGTTQTRSAKADFNDPVRKLLYQMTTYRGQAWEKALSQDGQGTRE